MSDPILSAPKGPVLAGLRRRLAGWFAFRGLLAALGFAAFATLLLVLADAALDLSDSTRAAAPWGVGVAMALLAGLTMFQVHRMTDVRAARILEQREPSLGDRLTNAVQLAAQHCTVAESEYFRREAVGLGQRAAAEVRAWPVVKRGMVAAAAGTAAAALCWSLFAWLGGDVLVTVLPRFLEPRGDHPPFSRLSIDVVPKSGEVTYGGQLEIRASTAGRMVDKLWLVAKSGAAVESTRTIMFLASDKSFFQSLANLRDRTEYFVTDGQARSHRYVVHVRTTPLITLVELKAEFPSYTRRPVKVGKLSDEPQAFPLGTQIRFRVASNRPLREGKLALTPVLGGSPSVVVLTPESSTNIVAGMFTLGAPTLFSLSVTDIEGLESVEPRRGRFNILPDERPRIAVLAPGRDSVATPSIRVPVKVRAEDDFGINNVLWLRGINRSIERSVDMAMSPPTASSSGVVGVESEGAFDLGKLGVRPGDVIEYFFEATDNDPKGPNVALTRPYRLQVISEEAYREVLLRSAARKALFEPYFKLGAWLRRLAERARELNRKAQQARSSQEGEAAALETEALSKELGEYRDALDKLMKSPGLFGVEESFRESLKQQRRQLNQTAEKTRKAARPLHPGSLGEVADELSALSQEEQEEVGQPAQTLAEVARVMARADEFVRMAKAQENLAQLLRRFSERNDVLSRTEQAEVEELKQQQSNVRDALKRYLETMPELLGKIPNDPAYDILRQDASDFLRLVAEAKIETDMTDATQNLGERDTMTGYQLARRAAEKMDQLISKCQGLGPQSQKCTARFQPKLPKAGSSLGQILSALGAGSGGGEGGEGYGLYGEDVGLYGPDMELAGEAAGGRRDEDGSQGSGSSPTIASAGGDAGEAGVARPGTPGRVRLQPNAKFPLKYRELVGDYFKSIAETGADEGETPR